MSDVFISYSRRDKVFTQKLFEALKTVNREVWADWDSIPAASDWDAEIKEGIEKTESVLFVLSPEWLKSNECRKEMVHAVQMGKRLFPILYLPVDPKDVPPELAKINWVYMRDTDNFEQGFQTLCNAMDTDLDWVKLHTRLQVRAIEWEKRKRDRSFTLRGKDLTDAEQFLSGAAGKNPEPTPLQGEYILASRKDTSRRQRNILIGVVIALVVSIALGIAALIQRQAAVLNSKISFSRELSAQAQNNLEKDPQLSLLLALQAAEVTDSVDRPILSDTQTALRQAIEASRLRQIIRSNPDDDLYAVAFSPNGELVATGSWGGVIKVWRFWEAPESTNQLGQSTGSPWLEPAFNVPNSDSKVLSIAFSPDSTQMATTNDYQITLWDTASGQQLFTLTAHTASVNMVAYSPDGKLLGSAGDDGRVMFWDTSTGKRVSILNTEILENDPNLVNAFFQPNSFKSVSFSPDGNLVACARFDGKIYIADVQSGEILTTLETPNQSNRDAVFTADGKHVFWSDYFGYVGKFDLDTGNLSFVHRDHKHDASDLAISPDGTLIASAGSDFTIVVLYVQTGELAYTLSGDTKEINTLAFSPDGRYIVSVNFNGETKFWDATPNAVPDAGMFSPQSQQVTALVYSPDGQHLAISGGGQTKLWSTNGSEPIILADSGNVTSLSYTADGGRLAGVSLGNWVSVWDSATGELVDTFTANDDSLYSVAFSPDGKYIAVGTNDTDKAILLDASTGNEVFVIPFDGGDFAIWGLAFSPDGKLLAAGSSDYHIKIIDVATGNVLQDLVHDLWVKNVAFSSDGTKLLSASFDSTAVVWDVANGEKLFTLSGHTAGLTDAVFNADGTRIATSSADGTVRVWDAETGSLQFIVPAITGIVNQVAFSPDGKFIVSGDENGAVRFNYLQVVDVLSLARSRVTRSLTETECITYLHVAACPDSLIGPEPQTEKPADAASIQPYMTPTPMPLASGDGSTPVTLEIENQTGETLDVIWVDFDGSEQPFSEIAPNESFSVDTYSTHVWHIYDQEGNLLLEYVMSEEGTQLFQISPDKQVLTPTPQP